MKKEIAAHFKDRICTVFTNQINRDFKTENPEMYPKQLYVYFVGLVVSIDNEGILLSQLNSSLKTFIYHNAIVGIAEEEIITEKEFNEQKDKKDNSISSSQINKILSNIDANLNRSE